MTDEIVELFTLKLTKFEVEGEKRAIIELRRDNDQPFSHSYCDAEEIIDPAFYRALTAVQREIDNAGLVERTKE